MITQYRVFISSSGGLQEERKCFRTALEKFSRLMCSARDVVFEPVGSEDTVGGAGRPQEQINEDLSQCDYGLVDEYIDGLDAHLARWLKDHEETAKGVSALLDTKPQVADSKADPPGFSYWISEAYQPLGETSLEPAILLFFAKKAVETAKPISSGRKPKKGRLS